jgi:hypothetical protein
LGMAKFLVHFLNQLILFLLVRIYSSLILMLSYIGLMNSEYIKLRKVLSHNMILVLIIFSHVAVHIIGMDFGSVKIFQNWILSYLLLQNKSNQNNM